jgi:hypothetical protein
MLKCLITDKAGNILRSCIVVDEAHARLQLLDDGAHVHILPNEAGRIADEKLMVVKGVLTAKPGVTEKVQHTGMKVTPLR